jgi:ABC-type branched-subunit amino acid transport system substrate-binding protein
VRVDLNFPFTGAQALSAKLVEYGVMTAFDGINAKVAVNGCKIVLAPYDDAPRPRASTIPPRRQRMRVSRREAA